MSTTLDSSTSEVAQLSRAARLRKFMQAYWLRPENAFWMCLRSETLAQAPWEAPALDVCCGDGVFSFLHHGGELDPAFDVFGTVGKLDEVRTAHADMFDHYDEQYAPRVTTPAKVAIEAGTDLKPALLAKARHLRLYDQLLQHDANRHLPLSDGTFQTVYCNAAYWVENVDYFLLDLARVLRPEGQVVLQVKLDSLREYNLERYEALLGKRVLDIIGRGRVATWPSLADRKTWERRFTSAGLDVLSVTPFITRTHAHVWDVGLRPFAPLLTRMANGLTAETRAQIKSEWVDLCCELLEPLCTPDFDLGGAPSEPGELQYVLTRG